MGYKAFIQHHGDAIAERLAGQWSLWRGTCCICGAVDAPGYFDRCVECALDSIFENEREYGGTTEGIGDYFGARYDAGAKHARLHDEMVERVLDHQAFIMRYKAEHHPELFTAE